MGYRARDLTRRIAFDAPELASDGHGGAVTGWAEPEDALLARAQFRYLRAGETIMAARLSGRQPIVVAVRISIALRTVTADWRMRDLDEGGFDTGGAWTGPVYNVRTPGAITEDRQFLEFLVESGVAV